MADVFKALADASRRKLLDRLFKRDGQTLGELCERVDMTRFGVMKHLRVLEEAGLLVTRRQGREKLHYRNPMPIRLVHDRWVSKYRAPFAAALSDLESRLEHERGVEGDLPDREARRDVQAVRDARPDRRPKTAGHVSKDGWQWVLSSLKSLLETGQ